MDIYRMSDTILVGDPVLQIALTLLKYGRDSRLQAALQSLFEKLARSIPSGQVENLLDTIRTYVMSVNPVVGEQQLDEMIHEFWPVKPEPGSVADQLLKQGEAKGEAKGEARGEAKGEAKGLAAGIRALQSVLGVTHLSDAELAAMSVAELQAELESMQRLNSNRSS
jgi:hypothetical protein